MLILKFLYYLYHKAHTPFSSIESPPKSFPNLPSDFLCLYSLFFFCTPTYLTFKFIHTMQQI